MSLGLPRLKRLLTVPLCTILCTALMCSFTPSTHAWPKGGNGNGNGNGNGGDPPPEPPDLPEYSIQYIGWSGGSDTDVTGMNNLGNIVGYGRDAAGDWRPFIYDPVEGMIDLNALLDPVTEAGSFILAVDINDVGEIVGTVLNDFVQDGNSETWSSEEAILLTLPADESYAVLERLTPIIGSDANARAINNAGEIAGNYRDASGNERAFFYSDATGIVDVGDLGSGSASAAAINASGQIAGTSSTGEGLHSFRYTPATDTLEDLGVLPAQNWEAWHNSAAAINDAGTIVGEGYSAIKYKSRYVERAFIAYTGGDMIDLGAIGDGKYSKASGLNNFGLVVGSSEIESTDGGFAGYGSEGPQHAFLWSEDFGMVRLQDLVINLPAGFSGRFGAPTAINDAGEIIGKMSDSSDAYLLTPVTP